MRRLTIAILIACGTANLAAPALAVTVKAGVEAWQAGDFSKAVSIWRPLATKGDADAQFNLGQAYRLGKGVNADTSQAKNWFERAAKSNHLDAQVSLGLLLFDSGERKTGLDWLMKAAERGEPRALLVTGIALFNGDEVAHDPVKAYAHVSRAAAQGLEPAKTTLAEMDEVLPLDQRQKGVAVALAAAKGVGSQASEPAPPNKVATKTAPPPPPAPAKPRSIPTASKSGVAKTPVTTTATGGWRIQLGAFSTTGAAQGLYGKLKARLGSAQPYYVKGGAVTRLQAGPYASRDAANSACARLKPQPCFAVKAPR